MAWDQISAQFVLLLFAGVVFQLCDSSEPVHRLFGRRLVASSDGHSRVLCPSNWVINQNKTKCFQFIATSKSWDESESYCKHTRGHLASLTSLQELNLAHKLCNKNGNGCWVGGRGINDTKGTSWVWSDRMSRDNDSVLLTVRFGTNCSKASCYNGSMVGLCTLLVGGQGLLSAEKCNKSHAFICMTNAEDKCSHGHCHREYTIILAVISGIILSTTLGAVIYLLASRRSKKRRKPRKQSDPTSSTSAPPSWKIFTIEELRSITKRFNEGNRLPGDAKTGGTYNGTLPDGSNVAVKRLKRPGFQRKKEFYSEVGRIARLRHPSLVSVKGCCYDHGDRYFVYEFIVNGPLDRWLHHVPRGGRCLNWAMRMKIAMSLAQGIAFLHDKVKPQVVHRDIRASNVLLDESFGAHLMGVGLSKFIPWEAIHEKTIKAGGTYGYLAPEFVYRNELTTKSDVYSFGVLLLEIVTGRKPAQAVDSVGWQSIFEWATPLVQAHQYPDLLDPMMVSGSSGEIPEAGVIQKVVDLVYACTQHVPSIRPRMSHVVHQLQQLSPPASAVE